MRASLAVIACTAAGAAVFAGAAMAEGGGQVIVTTRIVKASNSGDGGGGELPNPKWWIESFPYKSYQLLQQERRLVVMKRMEEFPVPGGRSLLVQPTGYENGRVSLYVMVTQGGRALVNTVLKLRNRGEFVVAGPHHEDGVLLLSIGATIPEQGTGLLQATESK